MSSRKHHRAIEQTLRDLLGPSFAGIEIGVSHSKRWNRPMVVARWEGFDGLMAEQRFERIMRVIPAEVYEQKLTGLIWFEITHGETIDDYLKMPRSEDIASKEDTLIAVLNDKAVFQQLADALSDAPGEQKSASRCTLPGCDGNFTVTRRILKQCGISPKRVERVCLLLIRHGAYCDCRVLTVARESVTGE